MNEGLDEQKRGRTEPAICAGVQDRGRTTGRVDRWQPGRLEIPDAVFCKVMIGYGARTFESISVVSLVLPIVLSIAFFLIADIDSPRGGIIHVVPQNLLSLAESVR